MKKYCAVFLSGSVFALSFAGCGNDGAGQILECGDEKENIGRYTRPVINGNHDFDSDLIQLSPSQVNAIGAVMMEYENGWENMCTGTLIAPDVVLTAAHCVLAGGLVTPASNLAFGFGEDVSTGELVEVADVHHHPDYNRRTGRNDVAVLVLKTEAREIIDNVVPIPYDCQAPDPAELMGEWVQTVGYGCIDNYCHKENTRRMWAKEQIIDISNFDFTASGFGIQGVCSGDSGGPALRTMHTGEVRIIGTLHAVDFECSHLSWYPATFDSCDFIHSYAAGCRNESESGRCDGDVLVYCHEKQVIIVDCSLHSKQCGAVPTGEFRCIDVFEPGGPCGSLTRQGRCKDNTVIWCENDVVKERRCADCMQTCGFFSEAVGYYCVDP